MLRPRGTSSRPGVLAATTLLAILFIAPGIARHADKAATRPMDPIDILDWKSIGPAAISDDGKWVAYRYSPVQGDTSIVVRATSGDKEYTFIAGEVPPPSNPPPNAEQIRAMLAFSDDGKWAAFLTYPVRKEAEKLKKAKKPIQTSVKLVDLATGKDTDYPKVRQFAFAGKSPSSLAMLRYGPEASSGSGAGGGSGSGGGSAAGASGGSSSGKPKGADLIIRDLASGTDLTVGSVSEFTFNKAGDRLAWTIDAEDKIGNGISVRDMKTGSVTPIDSGKASYEKAAWNEEGDALAVLKGVEDKAYEDKLYAVVGVSGLTDAASLASAATRKVIFDPATAKDAAFPAGMTISANRTPSWTDDRAALFFGIAEARKKDKGDEKAAGDKLTVVAPVDAPKPDAPKPGPDTPKPVPDAPKPAPDAPKPGADATKADEDDAEKPDLVLWHWKDGRLQSQQQVQEDRDKRFSYLATYRIAGKKFIRLADESLRDVTAPKKGRWVAGIDRREYELTAALEGRNYQDYYAVDVQTGERKLAAKKVRWTYGQSPDGSKLLYYDEGHFHVFDTASGQAVNITKTAPVSFVNVEDDHNIVKPPIAPDGWSADSKSVLLGDLWDVWVVPATGAPAGAAAAVNLTGNGKRDAIRYNRVQLDADEEGIDLSAPQYFATLGEWSKKGGFSRVAPGKPGAEVLAWDDAGYVRLLKAKDADTLVYSRETGKDYPDFYVADLALKNPRRITDGQAQVEPFAWTDGARLLDYTSDAPTTSGNGGVKGKKLQAGLYLPANYEPGKKYPTIVYIYEHLSDNFNRFVQPTAYGFNKSVYTSNGYAVLMPDITYTVNDPGMSAVWSVLPALKAAIATGVVDPARVGLQGHSWGGYQTSFLVTQTNAFKAAIAGAPLTNMVSMYSLVYKNTGVGNMAIFESSQGRFRGGYWDNWEAYVRNSPIAHASKVQTPLVIMHNDRDGAVDFTQGVEYYNTLRRLKKPVVMLQYVGENHNLVKPANRYDYTVRMREYFDHHLKGAPAPAWWTDGVPRLDMERHLKQRSPKTKKAPAPPPSPTTAANPLPINRNGSGAGL
jgi:dipeptidyl aminopeptidase/acylaminoacyl peptidase